MKGRIGRTTVLAGVILLMVGVLLAQTQIAQAADGDRDPAFGSGGVAFAAYEAGYAAWSEEVAVQADGKLLVAGSVQVVRDIPTMAVARFEADGALDMTFGDSGYAVVTAFPGRSNAADVLVQPDGKILIAGGVERSTYRWEPVIARYLPNGALDPGFGIDGIFTTDQVYDWNSAFTLTLQDDGKIILVGNTMINGSGAYLLMRLQPDGAVDPGFGANGMVVVDFYGNGYHDEAKGAVVLEDGSIVVAGEAGTCTSWWGCSNIGLVKVDTHGMPDPSFGLHGDGRAWVDLYGYDGGTTITVQPDGKLIFTGFICSGQCQAMLMRFNADGTLDPGFAETGYRLMSFDGRGGFIYETLIQPDGKIVTVGRHDRAPVDFALARLLPDGALDPTFGGDGIVTDALVSGFDAAHGAVLQSDYRLVAAGGATRDDGRPVMAVARYQTATLPPTCETAMPSIAEIWPADKTIFAPVEILGIADPEGEAVTLAVTGVYQDEPVDTTPNSSYVPDALVTSDATVQLRAERVTGNRYGTANGRVYEIRFSAQDASGGRCDGAIHVSVPLEEGVDAVNDGTRYDSTNLSTNAATLTFDVNVLPAGVKNFAFDGDLGAFCLDDVDDGDQCLREQSFRVAPGTYTVMESAPQRWFVSDIQCEPETAATVDLTTASADIVAEAGSEVRCTFTNEEAAVIQARKFDDQNGNGRRSGKEPWLAGWTLSVFEPDGAEVTSAITDESGQADFGALRAGSYLVCEENRAGWLNTMPGTLHPTLGLPCFSVTITANQRARLQFGNMQTEMSNAEATPTGLPAPNQHVHVTALPPSDHDARGSDGWDFVDLDEVAPHAGQQIFLPMIR